MLFMIPLAWKKRRSVIGFCLIIVVTSILLNLTQLFFIPTVLKAVEDNISVTELLTIILLFTGASLLLKAGNAYFVSCSQVGRIEVRLMIGSMIQNKILTMSYPDMENQDVQRKMDKASMMVASVFIKQAWQKYIQNYRMDCQPCYIKILIRTELIFQAEKHKR